MRYRRLFRFPFPTRHRVEDEVDDEIRFHLEMRADELVARGLNPEAARREARRRFGDLASARSKLTAESWRRERLYRRRIGLEDLSSDVRYGIRGLRRNPGFAAAAALTLALGIGATTAMFSVTRAVLLAPLPYPEPDRLVRIFDTGPRFDGRRVNVNPMNLLDWREMSRSFTDLGGYFSHDVTVRGEGTAELAAGAYATPGLLNALQTPPALGRNFTAEEYERGGPDVAMLSHDYWRRHFGGRDDVVGSTMQIDDRPFVIVGVMGRRTLLPGVPRIEQPLLWFPAHIGPHNGRGGHWLRAIARLRPGVEMSLAQNEMSTIAQRLAEAYPDSNTGVEIALQPLRESVVGDARRAVVLLAAAAIFVLLIACVNVAHMQMARATVRRVEMGVRAALGAGRPRLVRQLLAENLCLAGLGGALGVALAFAAVHLLRLRLGGTLPRLDQAAVDPVVLAFAAGVAMLSGLLVGLAPAFQGLTGTAQQALRHGGRALTPGGASRRWGDVLAMTQVALAVVLLSGAGLLIHSLFNLTAVDPGFDTQNVVALRIVLPESRYPEGGKRTVFLERLLEETRALPGVIAAGASDSPPFQTEQRSRSSFLAEDQPEPPRDQRPKAYEQYITPGYLASIGLPPRGRDVTRGDGEGSPGVILVNEALAERIWPGEDALGKRIAYNGSREVVGVVPSARRIGLDSAPEPEMYLPYAQWPYNEAMFIVVRTAAAPSSIIAGFRSRLAALDPSVALGLTATMEQLVSETLAAPRSRSLLLGLFAAVAVVLALLGVYGVLSYSVNRRTHEFGIRLALGATPGTVRRLVLLRGLALASAGVGIGLVAALALARVLESLLFEVSASDPFTLIVVAALFLACAALACALPARRATRTDAIIALRSD
jgi:putative ABC transport system permease protein